LTFATTFALFVAGGIAAAPAVAAPKDAPADLVRAVKKSDPGTNTTGRVDASRGKVRAGGLEVSVAATGDVTTVGSDTVLDGGKVDIVARSVEQGFQLAAVIGDAGQGVQTYRFTGKFLELLKSGYVVVRTGSMTGEPVAVIDPAWAVDANGAKVGSRYTVEGDLLTQVSDISGSSTFPVVADPRVRLAWYGFSVDFTKAETKKVALAGSACAAILGFAGIIASQAGVTASIVVDSLTVACGVMGALADIAYEDGNCISVKIFTGLPGATAPWINKCYK
jgi:hypothetical protein